MNAIVAHFFMDPVWEAIGLLGQFTFGSRFVYQWFVSERAKRSMVPTSFWWISIVGSLLIFIYAIHKGSLAFMIPTLTGVPIYIRNLMLVRKEEKRARSETSADDTPDDDSVS